MDRISSLDWLVVGLYLTCLISLSFFLSLKQKDRRDYYVAGKNTGPTAIAVSVLATQCSTNSILGAPAFVAFAAGGGLLWLQYELAVPLAMIFIMVFMMPILYRLQLISVYEYLERRFDLKTRLLLSAVFQLIRVFATAVTVYSISIVIELITGLSFLTSVLLLGVFTVVYDVLGGMKAVIYSDVVQMILLVAVLIFVLFMLIGEFNGLMEMVSSLPSERQTTIDFAGHGLGDGKDFAFWPMLLGGFFLYVSYYGCDQSQVQRELCAKNQDDSQRVLLINGLLRFPIVLLYCLVGVGIAVYSDSNPSFLPNLPVSGGEPNYNLAVPVFLIQQLPVGIVGLTLVALFAAAMSSLDSVINSLSATSMEDFLRRFSRSEEWSGNRELLYSRLLTLFWGIVALSMSFFVGDIASTVLVAINKVGSLINGPILGVFCLGLLTKRATGNGACIGLILGFMLNLALWLFVPTVSWLWWNVFGFFVTVVFGYLVSLSTRTWADVSGLVWSRRAFDQARGEQLWGARYGLLTFWTFLILSISFTLSLV